MTAIRESIYPKLVNIKTMSDITSPEPEEMMRTSTSRKSRTHLGRLSLMCFAVVGAVQLIPQAASAEPRTGEAKYNCAWKNEYVCTAAPGGGGKLSNCHTERVWDCVAVSGPGSQPNAGGSKSNPWSGVLVGSLPTGPRSPAPGGRPVITSPVGVRPITANPVTVRPIATSPVAVRPAITSQARPVSFAARRAFRRSPVTAAPSSHVASTGRR
jgi:hypothetical protein